MTDLDGAGRQGRTCHTGNLAAEMCELHTAAETEQSQLPGMPVEGPQGQVSPGDGSKVTNQTTRVPGTQPETIRSPAASSSAATSEFPHSPSPSPSHE